MASLSDPQISKQQLPQSLCSCPYVISSFMKHAKYFKNYFEVVTETLFSIITEIVYACLCDYSGIGWKPYKYVIINSMSLYYFSLYLFTKAVCWCQRKLTPLELCTIHCVHGNMKLLVKWHQFTNQCSHLCRFNNRFELFITVLNYS